MLGLPEQRLHPGPADRARKSRLRHLASLDPLARHAPRAHQYLHGPMPRRLQQLRSRHRRGMVPRRAGRQACRRLVGDGSANDVRAVYVYRPAELGARELHRPA